LGGLAGDCPNAGAAIGKVSIAATTTVARNTAKRIAFSLIERRLARLSDPRFVARLALSRPGRFALPKFPPPPRVG
jgi:hypothetical protein